MVKDAGLGVLEISQTGLLEYLSLGQINCIKMVIQPSADVVFIITCINHGVHI